MGLVDKSIVLTDAVIDDLMDDWFERDGETFIHKRSTERLGWEETLEAGESYSAYLLEAPTIEDLIKRAYSLAKDTIIAMNPPYRVRIQIRSGASSESATDGKTVYVSTAVFDDTELSTGEKLDTFLGLTVHEGCHLLYTDLSKLGFTKIPLIHHIWNILEDERIERICGEEKPGLANFLEKSKYYYFDHYYLDYTAKKEAEDKLTPLDEIMGLFFKIIRYPKYLKEDDIIKYAHYLIAIKKVVFPYPKDTDECTEAAKKVYEIIKEFYEHKEEEETESSKGSEGDSESEGKSLDDTKKSAIEKLTIDTAEIVEVLSKVAKAPDKTLDSTELSREVRKDGGLLGELCEGIVEIGSSKDVFFTKAPEDKERYLTSLSEVRHYAPAISRIMKGHCKEYKLIHRSMRSGTFDTNKLAEAYQGVSTVYIREGEVKTDKVSVCVLIDESGSMDGRRITAARNAAVLINEALCQVPNVELFIYGHTGDRRRYGATEIMIYRERNYRPKYSLGSCDARYENRDGVAIYEVAQRVRKQTKNPVLFFILSDGAPSAGGYRGELAISHTKESVQKVEKMGFNVIQVCINHSYDPSMMFKNYVILENMATLASELGKAIKKSAMNAAKVHVS